MSFSAAPELVSKYLGYALTIQGRSELTVNEYYLDLRTFFKYIHMVRNNLNCELDKIDEKDITEKDILEVTSDDIENFMYFLRYDRDNQASARSRKVASIKSFYKYLTSHLHILEENPALVIERPKKDKLKPRYLTLNQSEKLLDYCEKEGKFKERNFAIITLLLNCGLRVSELTNLDTDSIVENRILIKGKGHKERILMLNDACLEALDAYYPKRLLPPKNSPDKKALFISGQRKRMTRGTVFSIVKKSLNGASLDTYKLSPHKLRHTAATLMLQYSGTDIKVLQDILGHDSLSSTQIYAHTSNQQVNTALTNHPLNRKE